MKTGNRGQAMVEGILSRLLDPQRSVSLDFLTPEEIPAWRYERLTMEEARQEPDFAAYFPEHIPEDFQPEEAWLDHGPGPVFPEAVLEPGQQYHFRVHQPDGGGSGVSVCRPSGACLL